MEPKMNYPPNIEGFSKAVGNFCNMRPIAGAKLKFWVYLKPPQLSISVEKGPET